MADIVDRQRGSAGMVIRRVKAEVSTLEELGLPDILKEISMSKRGLGPIMNMQNREMANRPPATA